MAKKINSTKFDNLKFLLQLHSFSTVFCFFLLYFLSYYIPGLWTRSLPSLNEMDFHFLFCPP